MLVGFVVAPMLVSVPGLTLLYVCVLWCSGGEGEKRTENRGVSVRGGKRKEKGDKWRIRKEGNKKGRSSKCVQGKVKKSNKTRDGLRELKVRKGEKRQKGRERPRQR